MHEENRSLTEFGITKKEEAIYRFLISNGPKKPAEIAKTLNMHKMEVYRHLLRMEKNGSVQVLMKRPKLFAGTPIEKIVSKRMFDLKLSFSNLQEEKERIMNKFRGEDFKKPDEPGEMALIQGAEKTFLAILEMRKRVSNDLCVMNTLENFGKILARDSELRKEFSAKQQPKYKQRVILQITDEKTIRGEELLKIIENNKTFQIKFTNEKIDSFPILAIRDSHELVLITNEGKIEEGYHNKERVALWTNNKILVRLIQTFFEYLWSNSIDIPKFPAKKQ